MKYFKINEFNCSCCDKNEMDKKFLDRIDRAREYAKTSFVILSGFRCKSHNRASGGTETSSHLKGLAADIRCENSKKRYEILIGLIKAGFNRLGIGVAFIHADCDQTKLQKVVWNYYNKTS